MEVDFSGQGELRHKKVNFLKNCTNLNIKGYQIIISIVTLDSGPVTEDELRTQFGSIQDDTVWDRTQRYVSPVNTV